MRDEVQDLRCFECTILRTLRFVTNPRAFPYPLRLILSLRDESYYLSPHVRREAARLYLNAKFLYAEAEGFEPSDQFPGQQLSRLLLSTAQPRLRVLYPTPNIHDLHYVSDSCSTKNIIFLFLLYM